MPTVSELGQKVKAKYPGTYDDLSDDELGRRVKAKYPGSYDDFSEAPSGKLDPFQYFSLPLGSATAVRADRAIDAFPKMGGIVGSVAMGVPGAAMYGGAMETLRRSLRGMPLDVKPILGEGVKQGALQLGGAALGAGAALASKTIGPAARMAQRALGSPVAMRIGSMGRIGLPLGGYAGGGVPGALAGIAAPAAGRAALKMALSPRTEALLGSRAFRALARHSPQAAAAIYQQAALSEEADATQTR